MHRHLGRVPTHCGGQRGGQVVAWGDPSSSATAVPANLGPCIRVDSHGYGSVAIRTDGTLACWGGGLTFPIGSGIGQCVDADAGTSHIVAVRTDGTVAAANSNGSSVYQPPATLGVCSKVAAGYGFSLALTVDGVVVAWGLSSTLPAIPADLGSCRDIEASGHQCVAIRADGTVRQWHAPSVLPMPGIPPPPNLAGATLCAGSCNQGAVNADQTVTLWGSNGTSLTTVPPSLGECQQVAVGWFHMLALDEQGTVFGWGQDPVTGWPGHNHGQASVPPGLPPSIQIAAGSCHTLALTAAGTVVAWGTDSEGESTVPTDLGQCLEIAAGASWSMALRSDRTVAAWGYTGLGTVYIPTTLGTCNTIAASWRHAVAIRTNGTLAVWGRTIQPPSGLGPCMKAAGGYGSSDEYNGHTLALKPDGTVVAFGSNNMGQCSVPTGLGSCTAIAAGWDSSAAIRTDGIVIGWGRDDFWPAHTATNPLRATSIALGPYAGVAILANTCPGDLNRDLRADGQDLATLLAAWGSSVGVGGGDINDDGTVDGADLAALLGGWGECTTD